MQKLGRGKDINAVPAKAVRKTQTYTGGIMNQGIGNESPFGSPYRYAYKSWLAFNCHQLLYPTTISHSLLPTFVFFPALCILCFSQTTSAIPVTRWYSCFQLYLTFLFKLSGNLNINWTYSYVTSASFS